MKLPIEVVLHWSVAPRLHGKKSRGATKPWNCLIQRQLAIWKQDWNCWVMVRFISESNPSHLSNLFILSWGRWQLWGLEYSRSGILNSDCCYLCLILNLKNAGPWVWISCRALPCMPRPWVLFPGRKIKRPVKGIVPSRFGFCSFRVGSGVCALFWKF